MSETLYLKNIGMIKKAEINLDGLCVIAGENDTGKSTVGKILMALIKTHNMSRWKTKKSNKIWQKEKTFDKLINLIFNGELKNKGKIVLSKDKNKVYEITIERDGCGSFKSKDKHYVDCTYIQSPLVWDLFDFFTKVRLANDNARIYGGGYELVYPYLIWDLYQKIGLQRPLKKLLDLKELKEEIVSIINGHFLQNNKEVYKFYRNNKEISIENVATGIKQFGILQTLINNNRITPRGFLIFDEPENHLHPTWQILFAKILVKLSTKNIPILVNTHSPYMIEAFYKYALSYETKINFHLSSKDKIGQIKNNEKTMELIFEKLNKPFEIFDELDKKNG
ncbi:ABC transporter ATP-binding protein [Campylobacter jejuni]|uniref:AAA family ATPase n=1 Tax=Campylobacter jejuni TaxID=197 RepID=UPI000873833E|nr:AAA family ATPase [Campylobacter jejuni]EKQ1039776.1 AAA family ATPase [Campylobacter jejuni]OEV51836.1 ABC transporter ATP-binding protein [Campylobacter jejuni]